MKKLLLLSLITLTLSACNDDNVDIKKQNYNKMKELKTKNFDDMNKKEQRTYLSNGGGKADWKTTSEEQKLLDDLGL